MPNPIQLALIKFRTQTRISPDEAAAFMAVDGTHERIAAGTEFVPRGRAPNSVNLVVDGLAARAELSTKGTRQISAFYVAGDIPDLYSLTQPITAWSLHAITSCHVFRIPRQAMAELAIQFPGLMEAFWRYTVSNAIVAAEWVTNLGVRPAPQRVAHLLCEIAVKLGRHTEGQVAFDLPVTQNVLAEAAGISTVHMNRCLGTLRRMNLVRFDHSMVNIPDWRTLAEWAEFDESYLTPHTPLRFYPESRGEVLGAVGMTHEAADILGAAPS